MKAKIFLMMLVLLSNTIVAQIAGVSGTKLLVPNASTLSKGHFDFEPAFSIFSAKQHFNNEGELNDLMRSEVSSSVSFRVTMGVAENFEIGTSFTAGMEDIYISSKFTAYNRDNIVLGLTAGGSLPGGNYPKGDAEENHKLKYSYGAGVILSYTLGEVSSLDGIFTYSKINGSTEFNHLINYGVSFGYFFTGTFQAIMELNSFTTFNGSFHSNKISITPGFTYQFSQYLLLVFGVQNDIWGNNELSGTNYITAFTMSF